MTPMTINAYANPPMNEIVFPAAILQPPFFDPNADPAVNYGGIGAVIGHELSHHFDDQGRKYDPSGKLADWWTAEDVARFKAFTDKLVAQYDAYEPLPGQHVNGELTLGENIADLAGLTVAYEAYKKSLNGKPAPVIDGLTGDQRFYLGWAQVWRSKLREQALRQQLLTDPHSPGAQRVAIVRNLDPWYAAFGVEGRGEALYLGARRPRPHLVRRRSSMTHLRTLAAGLGSPRSRWPRPPLQAPRPIRTPQARPAPAHAPQYGTFGFDEAGMDRTVAPGDDFYDFANGAWLEGARAIPADKSSFGMFNMLADLSRDAHARDDRGRAGRTGLEDRHRLCRLSRHRRDRGEGPGADQAVARQDQGASTRRAMPRWSPRPIATACRCRSAPASARTPRSPTPMSSALGQAGLGMPDRDYYLSADPKLVEAKAAYQAHIARMFTLAGEPDAEARAKAIVDFETEIAKVHWTRIESRDADKTYNKMTVADLAKIGAGLRLRGLSERRRSMPVDTRHRRPARARSPASRG